MVGWHHQLNGHESEQTPGVGKEEGSLLCRSPWSAKSQTRLSTEDLCFSNGGAGEDS